MWYRTIRFLAWMGLRAFFRLKVTGVENIPAEGPVIIASNHQSYIDPPLLGTGIKRPVNFMARKSLFQHNFLFAALIRSLHAYPVERDRGDVGAIRAMMRRLADSEVIVVFPEGTRTMDGTIGELKPGIFMMAVRSRAPIVPALIEGAFEAWPRKKLLPRPKRVFVRYGKPIYPASFDNDADKMHDAAAKALSEMREEARTNGRGAK